MRPTCRAFLAFASLVALPANLARAGDPSPTPAQDGSSRKADSLSLRGFAPEVTKAIDALFDAPTPPHRQPGPTDVPVLGVLFRREWVGGWTPWSRSPERNDAKPVDARRAELEALVRKAVEDALAFRRALGDARGRALERWLTAPLAPTAPKPPKAPAEGRTGRPRPVPAEANEVG
jgi:hypothetical protein